MRQFAPRIRTDQGDGSASSRADSYIQLAVYDLVGALFAPSDSQPVSRHTDKLFARIRRIIKDRFADPEFGPFELAAEAGISLRYVQKLCTERGTTCSEFIYSLRLDHDVQGGEIEVRSHPHWNKPKQKEQHPPRAAVHPCLCNRGTGCADRSRRAVYKRLWLSGPTSLCGW
jgi:hypothetical protein